MPAKATAGVQPGKKMSEKLDHIDDFFKGELDAEQLESFERRIAEDPGFAEEVAFYLSSTGTLRQQVTEERKVHFRKLYDETNKRAHRTINLWPYMAAAASIVVILIGAYFLYPSASPEKIAETYINKNLSTLPVVMSSGEDSVQHGLRLYNEGKFNEASEAFAQILANHPDQYKVREYAGIVSLRMKNYDNALAHFERLSKATHLYANSGNFYISLTLLKRNRPGDAQKAKAHLEQLVHDREANEEAARELLKRL